MKKMLRFEVIDISSKNDVRLTFEGKFNDYAFGGGVSRRAALQFAVELIQEEGTVEISKALLKEVEKADDTEFGGHVDLAIRFYFDRDEEDAEVEANIAKLVEEKRAKRQALIESGELSDDELVLAEA